MIAPPAATIDSRLRPTTPNVMIPPTIDPGAEGGIEGRGTGSTHAERLEREQDEQHVGGPDHQHPHRQEAHDDPGIRIGEQHTQTGHHRTRARSLAGLALVVDLDAARARLHARDEERGERDPDRCQGEDHSRGPARQDQRGDQRAQQDAVPSTTPAAPFAAVNSAGVCDRDGSIALWVGRRYDDGRRGECGRGIHDATGAAIAIMAAVRPVAKACTT